MLDSAHRAEKSRTKGFPQRVELFFPVGENGKLSLGESSSRAKARHQIRYKITSKNRNDKTVEKTSKTS